MKSEKLKKMFKRLNVNDVASEAIFIRQMGTEQAVKYVQRKAKVNEEMAVEAVKNAPTWYKTSSNYRNL